MRRVITVIVIFFVSGVFGVFLTPPDPYSAMLCTAVIFILVIACYTAGLREGRIGKVDAAGGTGILPVPERSTGETPVPPNPPTSI